MVMNTKFAVVVLAALIAVSNASHAPATDFDSATQFLQYAGGLLVNEVQQLAAERGPAPEGMMWKDAQQEFCPNNSYFDFIPVYLGTVKPGDTITVNGTSCFTEYKFGLDIDATGGNITLTPVGSATSALCSDFLLFTSRERSIRVLNSNLKPSTVKSVTWVQYEYDDVKQNGLYAFVMPCGLLGTVESALKTVGLFTGNGTTQAARNMDFLLERKIWQEAVPFNTSQAVPASLIRSGDYFAVARLDGLDPLVMYGTGGHTGHSTILVHDPSDGELYVCESTAANPFGTVYWPPPYGIIRTPYSKWIELAHKANYHLALLPLNAEHSAAFNETRFWQWFNSVEGQPYGFHTFLYTFLDTANPMANMPKPIENPGFSFILEMLERLLPNNTKTGTEGQFYSLFMEAMNHRLPTTCPDLRCVFSILDPQHRTLGELTSIPEMDGWIYSGGNFSMVCSVFAFHGWKAGFGDFWPSPMEAGEQTPKDNYMMQLYDGNWFNKDNCPTGLHTTPQGTYCQLMGEYRLNLPGYNTVPAYKNMNNHCPAQWPSYFRCPANNVTCC